MMQTLQSLHYSIFLALSNQSFALFSIATEFIIESKIYELFRLLQWHSAILHKHCIETLER